jgi:ammonium transporter, Amt family
MEIGQWAVLGGAMLLLRAGLAIYLCGRSRSKNSLSTLFRGVAEMCVGMLAFWAVGYAILRHSWGDLFCRDPSSDPATFFAAMVCILGAGIAMAPTMERSRPPVAILGAALFAGVVVPLVWRLAWGDRLSQAGFADLAGSSYVHWSGAMAGLAAVLFIGPRQGKYNRDGSTNVLLGHHGVLTSIGLMLMLAFWPAYVAGCALIHGEMLASGVIFNTALGASAGAAMAMVFSEIRFRKPDVLLVFAGLLSGLVAITGGADQFTAGEAVLVGAIAGFLAPWLEMRLDLVWKIDDPSGLIAVCSAGGLVGTLATAVFAADPTVHLLHAIGVQAVGLVLIGIISFLFGGVLMMILKMARSLRVTEDDEFDGLDLAEHDLNAYPDFQQTTIKSYHTREI